MGVRDTVGAIDAVLAIKLVVLGIVPRAGATTAAVGGVVVVVPTGFCCPEVVFGIGVRVAVGSADCLIGA